jgi:hypothetical protein
MDKLPTGIRAILLAINTVMWILIIAMGVGLVAYTNSVDAGLRRGANPGIGSRMAQAAHPGANPGSAVQVQYNLNSCRFFADGYRDGWCAAATADVGFCTGPTLVPLCFNGDYRTELGAFNAGFNRGERDYHR